MSSFTDDEIKFLQEDGRRLGRIATVGRTGSLHVAPVGFGYNRATDVLEIRGADLPLTKKWKDLARDPRVAIVIDDVLPPWHPRGVEVRGHATVIDGDDPVIVITPERIVSWGLPGMEFLDRNGRDV
ncbi:PPOX class F420-dependent oxidoreductase [Actinoplanes sp. TBRC 11911]|uniref:PPOX class F420-dependent oxidoreductase n=1 Tax=Actinoplanes sp. TBRC 11911 TaxID=2729386 RepID=UPI00145EC7B2|nr:PPOX class F420-dependent oxidoreductase [Actinoplanes sp. TBRC 11911]NMO54804.1 PPOX class F420-dependent oxidoreductase [Actinoplanes sp. TBRC 11911]